MAGARDTHGASRPRLCEWFPAGPGGLGGRPRRLSELVAPSGRVQTAQGAQILGVLHRQRGPCRQTLDVFHPWATPSHLLKTLRGLLRSNQQDLSLLVSAGAAARGPGCPWPVRPPCLPAAANFQPAVYFFKASLSWFLVADRSRGSAWACLVAMSPPPRTGVQIPGISGPPNSGLLRHTHQ